MSFDSIVSSHNIAMMSISNVRWPILHALFMHQNICNAIVKVLQNSEKGVFRILSD
jgi:hypothetical protein